MHWNGGYGGGVDLWSAYGQSEKKIFKNCLSFREAVDEIYQPRAVLQSHQLPFSQQLIYLSRCCLLVEQLIIFKHASPTGCSNSPGLSDSILAASQSGYFSFAFYSVMNSNKEVITECFESFIENFTCSWKNSKEETVNRPSNPAAQFCDTFI